jgi:hypothetical protein
LIEGSPASEGKKIDVKKVLECAGFFNKFYNEMNSNQGNNASLSHWASSQNTGGMAQQPMIHAAS